MLHDLIPPLQHVAVHKKNTIEDSYGDFLKCNYGIQDVKAVERSTRGQASNQRWHQFRKGTITASRAKDICTIVRDRYNTGVNKMLDELLNPPDFQSPSTKWGCSQEKVALEWYASKRSSEHTGFSLRQTGFYVSREDSLVGASPDGLCYCKCCRHPYRKWLVEVKSPHNNCFAEPGQAAWDTGAFTSRDDGSLKLKSDHKWNYQVQLQMGVVGVQLCHLVISTTRGNCIVNVSFDEAFYDEMMSDFETFIDCYLFQKLYARNMGAPVYRSTDAKRRLQRVRFAVGMDKMSRAVQKMSQVVRSLSMA